MSEENVNVLDNWTDEQIDFVRDLMDKGTKICDKTEPHANVDVYFPQIGGASMCPCRVDDIKLLYVAQRLLPNMMNYLVNMLPQFLYPYIVAYLQELSVDNDARTVNDLYDLVVELDKSDE